MNTISIYIMHMLLKKTASKCSYFKVSSHANKSIHILDQLVVNLLLVVPVLSWPLIATLLWIS